MTYDALDLSSDRLALAIHGLGKISIEEVAVRFRVRVRDRVRVRVTGRLDLRWLTTPS